MALAPRPLVHPQHPRRRGVDARRRGGKPQEGVGRDRHGEALDESPAGLAAQGEGNVALNINEALGAPGGGLYNPRQPLGEGALRATGLSAQEPACLEAENYRPALPWQIGQPALITAVHAR